MFGEANEREAARQRESLNAGNILPRRALVNAHEFWTLRSVWIKGRRVFRLVECDGPTRRGPPHGRRWRGLEEQRAKRPNSFGQVAGGWPSGSQPLARSAVRFCL